MTYPTDEEIDTTFPDNNTGEIGADDMRAFMKAITAAGKDFSSIETNVPQTGIFLCQDSDARIWVTESNVLLPRLRVEIGSTVVNLFTEAAGYLQPLPLATADDFPNNRYYWADTEVGEIQSGTTLPTLSNTIILVGASRLGRYTDFTGLGAVRVADLWAQSQVDGANLQYRLGSVLSGDENNVSDTHLVPSTGSYVEFVPNASGGTVLASGTKPQVSLTHLPDGWSVIFVDAGGPNVGDRLEVFCGHRDASNIGFNGDANNLFMTTTRQNAVVQVTNASGRLSVMSLTGDNSDFGFSNGAAPVPDVTFVGAGQSHMVRQETTGGIGGFFRGIRDASYVDTPYMGYVCFIQGATGGTFVFKSEAGGGDAYWINDDAGDDPLTWTDGVAMTTCRTALSDAATAGWPAPTACLYDHGYASMGSIQADTLTVAKLQAGYEWIMTEIRNDANTAADMRLVASTPGAVPNEFEEGTTGSRLALMDAVAANSTWVSQGAETSDKYRPTDVSDVHLIPSGYMKWMKQQARAYLNAIDGLNNDNNQGPEATCALYPSDNTRVILDVSSAAGIFNNSPRGNVDTLTYAQAITLDIAAVDPTSLTGDWELIKPVFIKRFTTGRFVLQFEQDMEGMRVVYPAGRIRGNLTGTFIRDGEHMPMLSFATGNL